MNSKFRKIIVSAIFYVFFGIFLSACSTLNPGVEDPNKTTPVYQGMIISKNIETLNKNKRDIPISDGIDQDDPFNNFGGETIETEIIKKYQIDNTPIADYFAVVNEIVYITVKVYNPTSYEILSFTLNGQKYQSFQFENGSDSENLILKISSGETIGIKEFTIDQIKYVDGTEIKDVPIEGNQTVKLGVAYTQIPLVEISNFESKTVNALMTISMSDVQDVLENANGFAKLVLYDGVEIVRELDIVKGTNQYEFNDLWIAQLYQFAVVLKYDLLDGNHQVINITSKYAFYTHNLVEVATNSTQDSTTFSLNITEYEDLGSISSIELYQNNQLIDQLETFDNLLFSDLLSDTLYEIRVSYQYQLSDDTEVQTVISKHLFTTLAKTAPDLEINNLVIGQESISFMLTSLDLDNTGQISKIRVLKNNEEIISLSDLSQRQIQNLLSNTNYVLEVTYSFNLNDGQNEQTLIKTLEFTTLEKEVPTVSIENIQTQQDNVRFTLDILDNDLVGNISAIKIYQGQQEIQTLSDLTLRVFSNLLSNNNYTIVVIYSYDLNDGLGSQELKVTKPVLTLEKQKPVILLDDLVISQEEASFNLNFNQNGLDIAALASIELFDNDTLLMSYSSLSVSILENLLSNHQYTLKVGYTYDLSDGKGVQTATDSFTIQTLPKQTPTLVISTASSDYQSIHAEIDVDDVDFVGQITSAVVKRNDVIQSTLSSYDDLTFTNLIPDSKHVIEITYAYDLNDGHGVQEVVATKEIYTAPYITVLSTEVINTEKLTEGDTLVLEVTVDNPQQMTFSRVQINGEYFDVSTVTTQSKIRVEFEIGSEYKGGTTAFVVEKIEGYNHNQERSFDIDENNVGIAFVNGDIFVESLKIVDQYDESLDYVMPGEEYYVKIDFDNPTGYNISELSLSYLGILSVNKFTLSDDKQTIRIKVISMESNTTVHMNLYSFTYQVDNEVKTKNVDNISDFIVAVINSNYQMIYTAQDLANMRRGYSYKLANDIDLTDYNWVPKDLNYIVLDGNGFAINNLRNVKTYVDTSVYYGLFGTLYASTVKNLTLNNVLIMITINNSTTQSSYNSYVGALAGYVYASSLENISINGEISLANNTATWGSYAGGIAGAMDSTTIEKSYISMIVSNQDSYTGLVAGNGTRVNVNKLFIDGSVFGTEQVGGVFGSSNNSNIINTYVYADIAASTYAAGMTGYASNSTFKSSYYIGNIYVTNGWGVAGIIGYGDNNQVKDSFSNALNAGFGSIYSSSGDSIFEGVYTTGDDAHSTSLDLNSIIVIMSQSWDLDVWSFKGELPVLKWEPTIRIIDVLSTETAITFGLASTDFDQVGEISSIELYLGNELIDSLTDFSSLSFIDLRYNTEYRIKVTYVYDYLDGQGETLIYDVFDVKTLPTTGSPEVSIVDVVVGSTEVAFDLNITDTNEAGSLSSIELYDLDGIIIDSLSSFDNPTFSNLDSITSYRIVVTYQFDLGDSYGTQELVTKYVFRTHPSFDLLEANLLNTEAVIVGETLVIELSVNNPDGVQFTEVKINDKLYPISFYGSDSIRIDLEAVESLGMGEVNLVIQELYALYEGKQLIYTFSAHNQVMVFINGDIYVTDISVLDLNGNPLEYALQNEVYLVEISFYNPSGYDIPRLTVNETSVFSTNSMYHYSINDEKTKVRLQFSTSSYTLTQYVEITNFEYTNAHMVDNKSRQVSGMKIFIPLVNSKEVRLISNASELLAMSSGYAYKLTNDIDMQGVSWTPILNFRGVFDGNNHVISNLSIVKTFEDSSAYIGLFGSTNGAIIKNLHMRNTNFVITIKSLGTSPYDGYVGTIVGKASYTSISNVTVNSNISVDNQTSTYQNFVGGIAGRLYESTVNIAKISGNLQSRTGAGSIAGEVQYTKMDNIYTDATVIGTDYSGSFIGRSYQSRLSNSMANGIVSNYSFMGYTDSQSIYENVISMSKLLDGNYAYNYNNNQKVSHVYSPNYSSTETIISYEQMIQIMKDQWDIDVWSFTDVVPELKFIPQIFFTDITADIDGVNFEFYIRDLDQIGELVSIQLRKDGVTVQEFTDLSLRSFENLRYSTTYEVVIIYQYTYDETLGYITLEFKSQFMTSDKDNVPTVDIIDVLAGKENVTFDLLIQDTLSIGHLTSIVLTDGQGVVQSLSDLNTRGFIDLISNHAYTLVVEYTYDYNDGFGPNILKVEYDFNTLSMETPQLMSMMLTAQNDAVIISDYVINDIDHLFEFYAYRIYKDNTLIEESFDVNFNQFAGLLSSTNYRFELEYHYDLNDGYGNRIYVHSEEIMTLASVAPTVNLVTSASQSTIEFEATLNDPDEVGHISKVELYTQLGVLVGSITASTGEFTGLDSYQVYEVRTYFEYSKNDGNSPLPATYKKTIKTSPELAIDSISILNTEAIIVGDTLVVRVNLNNPSGILFTSGIINGLSYNVSDPSPDVIRFDINVGSQFEGGLTTLELTSLVGSKELDQFNIPILQNNTIDVMINGEISVLSVEAVDLYYQPFDYYSRNTNYYVAITFDNPSGYSIDKIILSTNTSDDTEYTNFIFDESTQTAYIELTSSNYNYYQLIRVVQFTYSNENLPSRSRVSSQSTYFPLVNSLTPIGISTPQELQNMTSGNAYKLVNDIDLLGFNWQPIMNFRGSFDGNGYAINNLNIVKTFEDMQTYVGLFGHAEYSVIKNVILNNVNIIVSTKSAAGYSYEMYIGALVGYLGYYSNIKDVYVNGYIGGTNQTGASLYLGGMIGMTYYYNVISSSVFEGSLYSSNTSNSIYVGGISGYLSERNSVNNSYAIIELNGKAYHAGGITGQSYSSTINNSYATGSANYSTNAYYGGLVGSGSSSYVGNSYASMIRNNQPLTTVTNCSSCTLSNVYSLVQGTNQIVMTHEQILLEIESLWDHSIWDFENTDILGNPYLK